MAAVLRKSKGEKKERERYAFTLISIEGFLKANRHSI